MGTPVFLECNPHSSSAIIFGVQSTLQSRLIFGVRIDALQTALHNISRIGVQIGVLPLQIRTPIHISLRTPIQNTGLGVQCAECGVRNVECEVQRDHSTLNSIKWSTVLWSAILHSSIAVTPHSTRRSASPLRHSKMTRIFGVAHSTECHSK